MNDRKLRAVVVDDEELARSVLREYLGAHPGMEIAAECANGFEAVKAVNDLEPDVLFLDIQMPKLDGFEVLELLDRDVAVVFVTAYEEHALRAFEVHAVDYLLKPYSPERLGEAIARARARVASGTPLPRAALAAAARGTPVDRILVHDRGRVHVVAVDTLDYAEAQDDYVCLHAEGARHLKQQTLAALEAMLDQRRFVRIHRSYLLNVERLQRLEPHTKDSRVAVLHDGTLLPVSRSGYARLKELLDARG